ncbi:MAG: hypothetical protein A2X49_02125 [Lentisphaerae bacterium GWF2_52_8]|nr:MAG: hypothetical protein A2X49_02125 [Lentisphaerae bacterium GWF2_52_8]
MRELGKNIKEHLRKNKWTQVELAEKAGTSQENISRWINGKNYPELPQLIAIANAFGVSLAALDSKFLNIQDEVKNHKVYSNAQPITKTPPPIPIVAMAQAISYDRAFQRLEEFATEIANEYAPSRIDMRPGIVAFKAEGQSMEPYYPDGTIIYADPQLKPKNGARVIAKLREEQSVVFKIYYNIEGKTRLVSINKDGKDFEWTSPRDNPFEWIFVVCYSFRDELAIDDQLDNHGINRNVKV